MRTRWTTLALVCLLWIAAGDALRAGSLSIDRTRVYLSKGHPSELVTLTNDSDAPIRLQVTLQRWTQAPDDPLRFEATEDVVYFPALLTLEPKRSRPVRVGFVRPPSDREVAYRLIIEELPSGRQGAATELTVLTRLSVPVFVQPSTPEPQIAVETLVPGPADLAIRLINRGTAHALVENIAVTARAADGTPITSGKVNGWYVLADSAQTYRVDVPNICEGAHTFDVEWTSGDNVSRQAVPAASVCTQ